MTVAAAQVSVTSSATALETSTLTAQGASVLIRNRGAVAVYLGASNVAANTGYQLDPGEAVSLDAAGKFVLGVYGITASGSATCHVLRVGD